MIHASRNERKNQQAPCSLSEQPRQVHNYKGSCPLFADTKSQAPKQDQQEQTTGPSMMPEI